MLPRMYSYLTPVVLGNLVCIRDGVTGRYSREEIWLRTGQQLARASRSPSKLPQKREPGAGVRSLAVSMIKRAGWGPPVSGFRRSGKGVMSNAINRGSGTKPRGHRGPFDIMPGKAGVENSHAGGGNGSKQRYR